MRVDLKSTPKKDYLQYFLAHPDWDKNKTVCAHVTMEPAIKKAIKAFWRQPTLMLTPKKRAMPHFGCVMK